MRILQVHNRYLYAGGEDSVCDAEMRLLQDYGHDVHQYLRDNQEIAEKSSASVAINTLWSHDSYKSLRALIRKIEPSVVHVHNTLPLVSPAVYYASADEGVPVVQTLHNYRLMCVNGQFLRDGKICEDCIDKKVGWPGVIRKCYRDSHSASAVVATMLATHRGIGTWRNKVTRYIALTEFARDKLITGGLPPEKIRVKPNFAVDPDYSADGKSRRSGALYIGRLTQEKGLKSLITAWKDLPVPLSVAGDGPMRDELHQMAPSNVRFVGHLDRQRLVQLMDESAFLVVPSICYEACPMAVIEGFAIGLPVIASRLGAMAELVEDGVTGKLFTPDDVDDLTRTVRSVLEDEGQLRTMGENARGVYAQRFTPQVNYETLMDIYDDAINAVR